MNMVADRGSTPLISTKNDVKTVGISSKHLNFNGFALFRVVQIILISSEIYATFTVFVPHFLPFCHNLCHKKTASFKAVFHS